MITQARLKELLHYCPETGQFTWISTTSNRVKIGDVAGCKTNNGYLAIRIDNQLYLAHRLAWMYMNGYFPVNDIDHQNGIRHDNSDANLAEATRAENLRNSSLSSRNKSGHVGVSWCRSRSLWEVKICFDGKKIHIGRFKDKAEAILAREHKQKELGFHKNHGKTKNW